MGVKIGNFKLLLQRGILGKRLDKNKPILGLQNGFENINLSGETGIFLVFYAHGFNRSILKNDFIKLPRLKPWAMPNNV